jgi:hypothetical protein
MRTRLIVAALAFCVAPPAARAADEDNPFKNAKVGDFATYKMDTKVGGFAVTGTLTQTITAKTDKEATVKVTGNFEVGGMKMDIPTQEQKIDLTKPFDPTKVGGGLPGGGEANIEKGKETKEKVKVGGKEYDATATTYKVKAKAMNMEINADVKAWMAKDVPTGLVKMTMNAEVAGQKMEMTMELTETGNKKP